MMQEAGAGAGAAAGWSYAGWAGMSQHCNNVADIALLTSQTLLQAEKLGILACSRQSAVPQLSPHSSHCRK